MIALDCESHLIQPGIAAPQLVCATSYDGKTNELFNKNHAREPFLRALKEGIVGANLVYDLGVFCAFDPTLIDPIFEALENGRCYSVDIMEALDAVAKGHLYKDPVSDRPLGRYSLAYLEEYYLGHDRSLEKAGGWRFKYALLENVPLAEWPQEAVDYAKADAKGTWEVAARQLGIDGSEPHENLQCLPAEMRAAWALHLARIWGIRTDPVMVDHIAKEVEESFAKSQAKFQAEGLVKADGVADTKVLKARVTEAYDNDPPLTEKGAIKINRDTLIESGDELLVEYAEAGTNRKLMSTYLDVLRQGASVPINPSWNVFVATDRTSCSEPNLQNLPRGGHIREAFVPRKGWVFCSVDFSALELCTLAQVQMDWFRHSALADAINAGQDLHLRLGATTLGVEYEEALARRKEINNIRQASKATNFGTPGGMAAPKQVLAARSQVTEQFPHGIRFCELLGISKQCSDNKKVSVYKQRTIPPTCAVCLELAEKSRKDFFNTWPETVDYHDICKAIAEDCDRGNPLESMAAGKMKRLEPSFCAVANHFFQNRAAVYAKEALWKLAKESYTDRKSVLFNNFRAVAFIHDEILAEIREDVAHECAMRQTEVMVATMQAGVPDVKISAEPALFRRWFKGAEKAVDKQGHLRPWWPKDWTWPGDQEQMKLDLAK